MSKEFEKQFNELFDKRLEGMLRPQKKKSKPFPLVLAIAAVILAMFLISNFPKQQGEQSTPAIEQQN